MLSTVKNIFFKLFLFIVMLGLVAWMTAYWVTYKYQQDMKIITKENKKEEPSEMAQIVPNLLETNASKNVIKFFSIFEKSNDYKELTNDLLAQESYILINSATKEKSYQYSASMTQGSHVYAFFNYDTTNHPYHEMTIMGLSPQQCKELKEYFEKSSVTSIHTELIHIWGEKVIHKKADCSDNFSDRALIVKQEDNSLNLAVAQSKRIKKYKMKKTIQKPETMMTQVNLKDIN